MIGGVRNKIEKPEKDGIAAPTEYALESFAQVLGNRKLSVKALKMAILKDARKGTMTEEEAENRLRTILDMQHQQRDLFWKIAPTVVALAALAISLLAYLKK